MVPIVLPQISASVQRADASLNNCEGAAGSTSEKSRYYWTFWVFIIMHGGNKDDWHNYEC